MKYKKLILFTALILSSCNQHNKEITNAEENILKEGYWNANIIVQNHPIPFVIHIDSNLSIVVYNDKSRLTMKGIQFIDDSVKVDFNNFPTYFKFKINSNKELTGYFVNPDHKEPLLPLQATYVSDTLFDLYKSSGSINNVLGKWKVQFRADTAKPYFAIGQFHQDKDAVKGTFLKNSGDDGFLSGTFNNDTLKLYTFNGSSAGIYIADLKNDTLKGIVLSGGSNQTPWKAFRNDKFQLDNKDSLTYLVKDSLHFKFKTLTGADYTYPNNELKNKVIILQIMGTWCPNCLDETEFFKELYKKYHSDGLEIIGIAYERPKTFEGQVERVQRFIESKSINYPIMIGGNISSNKVLEDFSMLNDVSAFPTSLFISREGKVEKIYTGFSGPGTGIVYEEYKKNTIRFIEDLLRK